MSIPPILVLSEADVRRVLTVDLAVRSQREAFRALGSGEAVLPARLLLDGADGAVAFCYAARARPDSPAVSKFGSLNPGNDALGLAAINAAVTVLDAGTGLPAAIMDGTSITEIRTAAASAVAAEALAPRARRLGVLGTGVQASAHVRALAATHNLESVRIWGRDAVRRADAVARLRDEVGCEIEAATDARDAVAAADLIALCTTSTTPVIESEWPAPGATVISVGAFAATRFEYPRDLLERADVIVVDDRETAREHAGPVAAALADGSLADSAVQTLGEVLVGTRPGRTEPGQLAVHTSVGIGVQDATAAGAVLSAARELGVGRLIEL
ncbi:ornithine cyclodeaminase family protein [Streptomyces sp. NPDC002643]